MKPSSSERSYLYAAHKHVDPRLVGTRRLMLTPNYLSTNHQKNVYKLIIPYAFSTGRLLTTHSGVEHTVLRASVHYGPLCLTKP